MSYPSRKGSSVSQRIRSFKHAATGLRDMIRTEPNAWVHCVATVLVLGVSWWLKLDPIRLTLIILAIVSVWVAEAFNTVIEIVLDFVSPRYSDVAKRAKDIAAAAVFITCIGAAIIGIIILGPALSVKFTS